ARGRTEDLGSSPALPRPERLIARLATLLLHSGDAILVPLQAQGSLPSLADLRADDAGDASAAGIWTSSTGRSSGTSRTWRRRLSMSPVGGTARAALADVRFLPSVGTRGNRSAEGVPRSAAP